MYDLYSVMSKDFSTRRFTPRSKNNPQRGQSLLEVLVALGAATVIVTSFVVVIINALSNTQYSKNQNLAAQYAQEGMEIVRKMRDTDYTSFDTLATATTYCLDSNDPVVNPANIRDDTINGCSTGVGDPPENVGNIFARRVEIRSPGSCIRGKEVIVSVLWVDGKCSDSSNLFCHKVELRSCLTDFNVVPTP